MFFAGYDRVMGSFHESIKPDLIEWIERQRMFFVATAPLQANGHVNVSPKGLDSFRVIDENTVAYLDLTGSGAETIAHLRENGRITIMFCAFEGKPQIVRLFGTGHATHPGDEGWEEAAALFPEYTSARSVVTVEVHRVGSSCGFGVPLMEVVSDRDRLLTWADAKGSDQMPAYWANKNSTSIDGLPALS